MRNYLILAVMSILMLVVTACGPQPEGDDAPDATVIVTPDAEFFIPDAHGEDASPYPEECALDDEELRAWVIEEYGCDFAYYVIWCEEGMRSAWMGCDPPHELEVDAGTDADPAN
jgi:hypothetical protein